MKKLVPNIIGGLLIFCGCVWMGQGAGILPGKLMHNDPAWILWGGMLVMIGLAMLRLIHRRKKIVEQQVAEH